MAFMKLSVIISNSVISLIVFVLSDSFDYTDGHTGGVSGTVHEPQK